MSEQIFFTCIECPRGCRLEVRITGNEAGVSGHACPRGEIYGKQEALEPLRSLTSTVKTDQRTRPRLPVRSNGELPLARLLEAMAVLDSISVAAPIKAGSVVYADILGLGIDMVATDDLEKGASCG